MDMVASGGDDNIPKYYSDIQSARGAETGSFTDLYKRTSTGVNNKSFAVGIMAAVALNKFIIG